MALGALVGITDLGKEFLSVQEFRHSHAIDLVCDQMIRKDIVIIAQNNTVIFRIDLLDKNALAYRNAKSPTLSNRIMRNALMFSNNCTVTQDKIPGPGTRSGAASAIKDA